ncbi:hypothetical protein Tco_0038800 [Tanacetum coccineum]
MDIIKIIKDSSMSRDIQESLKEKNNKTSNQRRPFHRERPQILLLERTEGEVQQGTHNARVLTTLSAKKRKDIWENVKMILEGSELTKDDRESQLYDEFEHFRQNKGETIQGYYVSVGPSSSAVSNTIIQVSSSPQNEPSPADNFQLDSGSSSTENLIE